MVGYNGELLKIIFFEARRPHSAWVLNPGVLIFFYKDCNENKKKYSIFKMQNKQGENVSNLIQIARK